MSADILDVTTLSEDKVVGQCSNITAPFAARKIAWDCVFLGLAAVTAFLAVFTLGLSFDSIWSKLALVPLLTWFMLLSFSMGHEGQHGNIIRGGRVARFLNGALSTLFMAITLASWHGFSYTHRLHHGNANDPEKDANWWVVRYHGPKAMVTVLGAAFFENYYNYKCAIRDRRFDVLRAILTFHAVALTIFITAGFTLGWVNTLILWVLPSCLNYSFVVLFVGFLPHHVSAKAAIDGRYVPHDVVTLRGPVKQFLVTLFYLGNNYHALHHVYTRIPNHHLGSLARALFARQSTSASPPSPANDNLGAAARKTA